MTAQTTEADRTGVERSRPLSQRQLRIVFGGLMLGMLLAALDQTIVATALPTIVGDLGGLNHLSWVVTAYLLTSTAVTRCGASCPTSTAGAAPSRPPSSSSWPARCCPAWPRTWAS